MARIAILHESWLTCGEVGSDEIAVLAVLALHADKNGACWPSQGLLARLLNRSRPWVNKVITRLVDLGLLKRTHRRRDDGGSRACLYHLIPASPDTDTSPLGRDGGSARPHARSQGREYAHPASQGSLEESTSRLNGVVVPPEISRPEVSQKEASSPISSEPTALSPPLTCSVVNSPCSVSNTGSPNDDSITNKPEHQQDAHQAASPSILINSSVLAKVPDADWQPSDADLIWALDRYPDTDLTTITERFLNRCRAKGYRYLDIGAAWRSWLIDDAGKEKLSKPYFDGRSRHNRPSSAAQDRFKAWGSVAARHATTIR